MTWMRQVFPDRPVEDLERQGRNLPCAVRTWTNRFQVPGEQIFVPTGRTYEKDGYVAKWRAIRDDHGRIVVAISSQHAPGGCVGVGGRSGVSGAVCFHGVSCGAELYRLWHDPLMV